MQPATNELCARVILKSVKLVAEISSSLKDQPKMHYLLKIFEPAYEERNHQIKHQFALAHIVYMYGLQASRHTYKIHVVCLFIFHMECGRHWTRFGHFHLRQYINTHTHNRQCDLI